MSRGVNKVILLGNLGKDPEIRYSQGGTAVGNFSLATTERRKGADGQWADHTEWHNIRVFGRQAELSGQYLQKGSTVYIEGRIQTRKWQDKEGGNRYTTEILVNDIQFLGRTKGQGAPAGGPGGFEPSGHRSAAPADDFPGPPIDDAGFDPNDDVPF